MFDRLRNVFSKHKTTTKTIKNSFDGATRGRRSGTAYTEVSNVNDSIDADLETLRGRSLGGFLNSPMINSAVEQWVSDEIGSTATITPTSKNTVFNEKIAELWQKHERFLDLNGHLNLVGILSVCARERRIGGEVCVRRIKTRIGAYPVPLQIQLLKSSMIPMTSRTRSNGNKIKQGIEYSKKGKKIAIWFKKDEDQLSDFDLIRVPIGDIAHSFVQKLAGQNRGIPSTSPSLLKESEYNSYEENELNRKATQSSITGMITRDDVYEEEMIQTEEVPEIVPVEPEPPIDEPFQVAKFGPNQFIIGKDGEQPVFNNSPDVGQNYKDFTTNNQRLVSTGMGVPFQLVTSNYDGLNDRTLRQINNNHRRKVRAERMQTTEFIIVQKLWRWFVDAAIMSGLSVPDYWENRDNYRKCRFTAEAFAYDHAVQDLQSADKAIKLGVKSEKSFCEERGADYDQIIQDKIEHVAAVKSACEKAGISYNEYMGNIDVHNTADKE